MKTILSIACLWMLTLAAHGQLVVSTTVACATSTDGSVVGVLNPLNPPQVSPAFTGTLPAGNYYTQIAWYDAAGHITLVSPEVQKQLTGTGSLVVQLPTSGKPSTAVGMNVYIGAASGSETLQGQTTGGAVFTQSTPLTTGAAEPTTNNTICSIVANDAGWPTGTGYNVAMTTPAGNTMPGYPMQWQLLGPGSTYNLANGLPLYNGTVTYPIPLLARPVNHAPQSISGPLYLTNYTLAQIGALGVGTQTPGFPVDVENGAVNASGGYIYNGGTGVATGDCLVAGSDTYHTYVPGTCYTPPTPTTIFYQTIDASGTALTQRPVLNFDGTLAVTDSSSPQQTNVGLPSLGTPGTYSSPSSITFDAQGRETAITASSAVNRVCNSNGCYRIEPDGTIEEWGKTTNGTGSGSANTLTATFPLAFSTTTNLQMVVSPTGSPNGDGNPHPLDCHVTSFSTTGASVVLAIPAQIGGSGYASPVLTSQYCSWYAFGN